MIFTSFLPLFTFSSKSQVPTLLPLCSTMIHFHTPYLILSHVPFSLSYLLSFFSHFGQEGNHGHLRLLGLDTFSP